MHNQARVQSVSSNMPVGKLCTQAPAATSSCVCKEQTQQALRWQFFFLFSKKKKKNLHCNLLCVYNCTTLPPPPRCEPKPLSKYFDIKQMLIQQGVPAVARPVNTAVDKNQRDICHLRRHYWSHLYLSTQFYLFIHFLHNPKCCLFLLQHHNVMITDMSSWSCVLCWPGSHCVTVSSSMEDMMAGSGRVRRSNHDM